MRTLETILRPDEAFAFHPQAGNVAGGPPAAVADPETVDEVRAVVEHAAARGWRIAVQATGRGVRQLQPLADTLLIRTGALSAVRLDAPARIARAEGGAVWGDVTALAAPAGLTAISIPTPSVGVTGTVLTGGAGWLGREYGLASESLRAAEVVTADGRLLRADAEHERDLFWALRGGGGGLGVITAAEIALVAPPALHGGVLSWPVERTVEVLEAWRVWTATLPREVTTMARLIGSGPQAGVHVLGALVVEPARAQELLAPLRALAPASDSFRPISPAELDTIHVDVLGDRPIHFEHLLLHELPVEALEAFLEVAGPGAGLPILDVELRHLGGAQNDRTRTSGALGALDADYGLLMAARPERMSAVEELVDAVSPWDAGHSFVSFVDGTVDGTEVFTAVALRRLLAVKALYDPADRFLFPLG